MLTWHRGDEQAFIAAQSQTGTPLEKQTARQVQESVKKWKKDKKKKSSPPFDEINLFPAEEEAGNPMLVLFADIAEGDFDSSDSELNSTPTEENVDDVAPYEISRTQNDELSTSQEETLIVNSAKENSNDDLIAMRDEMQKLLAEMSVRMQRATKTELADTIQFLKSVRVLLNKKS